MSSAAQDGPSVPREKEKRLSNLLTRVKTVLKRTDRKRLSTLSTTAGPSASAAAAAAAATTTEQSTSQPPAAEQAAVKGTRIPRSQLHAERAKKINERFGLEVKPASFYSTEGDTVRVEKPVRMRVRRDCHKCGHGFGVAKECASCKHPRCRQCPRRPPKRTEAERAESRAKRTAVLQERSANPTIVPDWNFDDEKVALKRAAKSGGQDLVHKKPRQRVRRTCCQCQDAYKANQKTCQSCQHARCTDCPRDPAKKSRYPYGYPGDEFGANAIPHYECHECKETFPPNPSDGTACPNCSHGKCDSCQRLTPRKVDPKPDPEVLKTIQAKIRELDLK